MANNPLRRVFCRLNIESSTALDVRRYTTGGEGIVAQLSRAIVVGPIARLKLVAAEGDSPSDEQIIEAQIQASQYYEQNFAEGETLILTPRKARVFVE